MTTLIGVVHVPALPGAPRNVLSLDDCIRHAVADAEALRDGGADAVIVENFHDYPFRRDAVEAHVVAALTAVCLAIRASVACELGVNVLRNDALSALGIAMACGAAFIRVNVHTGAMLTDQGIITGRADETMRLRRALGADHVRVLADVLVKHAVPLGALRLADAVRDATDRGLADAIIVTGGATGMPATREDVETACGATTAPVYVGSGVTAGNVDAFVPPATGVIAGSWLKRDGLIGNPVDATRVRRLRQAIDRLA
ncbi:MAG TPA: BtpA/SgcQ family protein [Thermomicrobiales bacterium]|nr:BtpA/SgcQ family protein [Thermomicrobiales bacterium]